VALDKVYRALPEKWDAPAPEDVAAKVNAAMFANELTDAQLVKQRLARGGVPPEQLDAAAASTTRQFGGASLIGDKWSQLRRRPARRTAATTNQHGSARGGHLPPVDPTAPTWSQDALRLTVQAPVVGPVPPVTWIAAPAPKTSPEKERVGKLKAEREAKRALVELKDQGAGRTDRQREAHVLVRIELQGKRGAKAEAARRMGIERQTLDDLLKKYDKATKSAT